MKHLAVVGMVLALSGTPALAAERAAASEPVTLDDHALDQVTAGEGSLLFLDLDLNVLLRDIAVTVNVSNVPINAAVVVQANALGQALQTATVTAGQMVTQAQSFGTFQ